MLMLYFILATHAEVEHGAFQTFIASSNNGVHIASIANDSLMLKCLIGMDD